MELLILTEFGKFAGKLGKLGKFASSAWVSKKTSNTFILDFSTSLNYNWLDQLFQNSVRDPCSSRGQTVVS